MRYKENRTQALYQNILIDNFIKTTLFQRIGKVLYVLE